RQACAAAIAGRCPARPVEEVSPTIAMIPPPTPRIQDISHLADGRAGHIRSGDTANQRASGQFEPSSRISRYYFNISHKWQRKKQAKGITPFAFSHSPNRGRAN